MSRRVSAWEQDADELAQYIENESEALAQALIGDGPAPFSANVTQRELLEFYTASMFNPDGSENVSGRVRVMQKYGPVQYTQILRAVLDSRGTPMPEPVGAY